MAHAQKPDLVFRWNARVHLNRRGRQFSRLLAAEVCASAVVMLDTPCNEVVWRVLATHSFRQFPLHFPSCASPCAIAFQLDSTNGETAPGTHWIGGWKCLGAALDILEGRKIFWTCPQSELFLLDIFNSARNYAYINSTMYFTVKDNNSIAFNSAGINIT